MIYNAWLCSSYIYGKTKKNIMNKHILEIKRLVSRMNCMGTYGLIELELNEIEKLIESKESINKNDCIADVMPCLDLPDLTIFAPDSDDEFELAHSQFNYFINKEEADHIVHFFNSHLNKV